ncbi:MAG: flagellar hook-basal body complex protein FliE [Spirochaetes bacterium]|nr:flagellar hook-basal body complex protein FliE [Spirochaetota bacterium]
MNTIHDGHAGHVITMKTSHPLHNDGVEKRERAADDVTGSFADSLMKALGKVNDLQGASDELTQQMIYAPESVSIHSVMIAAQKAEIALSFTRAVRDEAVRAYRELINLR